MIATRETERGVFLGLTLLLRVIGLPTLGVLRGLLATLDVLRQSAAAAAADAADRFGLPEVVQSALEGYRDQGLPGISRHLDYRRCVDVCRCVNLSVFVFVDVVGALLAVYWTLDSARVRCVCACVCVWLRQYRCCVRLPSLFLHSAIDRNGPFRLSLSLLVGLDSVCWVGYYALLSSSSCMSVCDCFLFLFYFDLILIRFTLLHLTNVA